MSHNVGQAGDATALVTHIVFARVGSHIERFQRGQGVQGFAAAQRVGTPTSKHNDVIALPTFPSSRLLGT